MATSGSYDFGLNRDEIIQQALENIKRISPSEDPHDEDVQTSAVQLNLIVKELQNDGIRLWTVEDKFKTFTASSEVTGTDGLIYTCIRSHTSASATRPITGANYTSYWIQSGTTGGVWADSTAYTAIGDFQPDSEVIGIVSAYVRDDDTDTPLTVISMKKYRDISTKGDTGKPDFIAFDRRLSPTIYLYPQPDETDYVLHYFAERKLEDFDEAANDPDFESNCLAFLIWELSYRLTFKFSSASDRDRVDFKNNAIISWKAIKRKDAETDEEDFIEPAY